MSTCMFLNSNKEEIIHSNCMQFFLCYSWKSYSSLHNFVNASVGKKEVTWSCLIQNTRGDLVDTIFCGLKMCLLRSVSIMIYTHSICILKKENVEERRQTSIFYTVGNY